MRINLVNPSVERKRTWFLKTSRMAVTLFVIPLSVEAAAVNASLLGAKMVIPLALSSTSRRVALMLEFEVGSEAVIVMPWAMDWKLVKLALLATTVFRVPGIANTWSITRMLIFW